MRKRRYDGQFAGRDYAPLITFRQMDTLRALGFRGPCAWLHQHEAQAEINRLRRQRRGDLRAGVGMSGNRYAIAPNRAAK